MIGHTARALLLASAMLVGTGGAAPLPAPGPTGVPIPTGCVAVVNASAPGCPWVLDVAWVPTPTVNFYAIVAPGPAGPGSCSGAILDIGTYTWSTATCFGTWTSAMIPGGWGTVFVPPTGTVCPGTAYQWSIGPAGTVPTFEF